MEKCNKRNLNYDLPRYPFLKGIVGFRGSTGCGVGTVEQYYTDSQRNMAWIDTTMAGAGAATAPAVPQRYKDKTKKPKGKTSLRRKFWSKDDPDPGETFNIITEEEDDVKTV